jgi:hypothetical protein
MRLMNRAAIIVKPKHPYIVWANALDEHGPKLVLDSQPEHTIYLIDDVSEYIFDVEAFVRPYFEAIFEHELGAWHRLEDDWPSKRDYVTFLEWFDVEVHSMVLDLASEPIKTEPFGSH